MKKYILLTSIFILLSCDYDRYFSYDTDAEELLKTTPVKGRIMHYYRNEPVSNALVQVGAQETLTDINGFYNIDYILTDNEERNKPVQIQVSAHNFYSESLSTLIEPLGNTYNFSLKYAAPIINDAIRRFDPYNKFLLICQAVITDYQGWQDIDSVYAIFYNSASGEPSIVPLQLVGYMGDYVSHYQATYQGETNFELRYSIIAIDKDNYSDQLDKANTAYETDNYLFTP